MKHDGETGAGAVICFFRGMNAEVSRLKQAALRKNRYLCTPFIMYGFMGKKEINKVEVRNQKDHRGDLYEVKVKK